MVGITFSLWLIIITFMVSITFMVVITFMGDTNVTITGLYKTSLTFLYVDNKDEKLKLSNCLFSAGIVFFSTEIIRGQISTQMGVIA